jgi:hypothetical protein
MRDQVSRRFEGGASSESDLRLAQLRLESVVLEVTTQMVQQQLTLVTLSELLGRKVDSAELNAFSEKPAQVDADYAWLLDSALSRHPLIRKSQAQILGLEATITERQADLSPEVFVRAERQYGDFSLGGMKPQNRIFIGLNTRFGPGLSSLTAVAEARSRYASGVAELETRKREIRERVISDHSLFSSFDSRIAALKSSSNLSYEVFRSFTRQYLAGHRGWRDVMNAAREFAQNEIQLADTSAAQLVVSWRLSIYAKGLVSLEVPPEFVPPNPAPAPAPAPASAAQPAEPLPQQAAQPLERPAGSEAAAPQEPIETKDEAAGAAVPDGAATAVPAEVQGVETQGEVASEGVSSAPAEPHQLPPAADNVPTESPAAQPAAPVDGHAIDLGSTCLSVSQKQVTVLVLFPNAMRELLRLLGDVL